MLFTTKKGTRTEHAISAIPALTCEWKNHAPEWPANLKNRGVIGNLVTLDVNALINLSLIGR